MSDFELARLGAVIASDLCALILPGSGTISHIFQKVIDDRRRKSVEILIDELSHGIHGQIKFEDTDVEPVVAMVLRISRAISDGTSIQNIRLLSQVIAGLKTKRALSEDAFLKWAKILEDLTRDELLILGFSCLCEADVSAQGDEERAAEFWRRLNTMAGKAGFALGDLHAICASLARTGLLVPIGSFGPAVHAPSPWLAEIRELIDIPSVVRGDRNVPDEN
ncbi:MULTISPECIES: hypothetical protein [unclassified Xanthobacter]|uniref:hypothetical protein n=1 Tax=unclassified Xanthobacter TaxID=2623496 RepID=UPI001F31FA98|nr:MULTISPECIES: hypothetical protein [unclassified Xanthobacter]